jgi:hypothetical protein
MSWESSKNVSHVTHLLLVCNRDERRAEKALRRSDIFA